MHLRWTGIIIEVVQPGVFDGSFVRGKAVDDSDISPEAGLNCRRRKKRIGGVTMRREEQSNVWSGREIQQLGRKAVLLCKRHPKGVSEGLEERELSDLSAMSFIDQ